MPITITPAMRTHLDEDVTTLSMCWRVERTDGVVLGFIENTRNKVIEGVTYLASAGFKRSAIASDDALGVGNLEVVGFFDDDALSDQELRSGLYDHAQIYVFAVNWADLSMGTIPLRRGRLGEVTSSSSGLFSSELRGLGTQLMQQFGELYMAGCRTGLGNPATCKVPIIPAVLPRNTPVGLPTEVQDREARKTWRVADLAMDATDVDGHPDSRIYHDRMFECVQEGTTALVQPTYDYTVGVQTTDGTAVFECKQAWTRSALITAVTSGFSFQVSYPYPDPREIDDAFLDGQVYFESGENAGAVTECKASTQATGTLVTYLLGRYVPQVGDRITVSWGCDHTINGAAGCVMRFLNPWNYRGEPAIPGADQLFYIPDAGGGDAAYLDETDTTHKVGGSKLG